MNSLWNRVNLPGDPNQHKVLRDVWDGIGYPVDRETLFRALLQSWYAPKAIAQWLCRLGYEVPENEIHSFKEEMHRLYGNVENPVTTALGDAIPTPDPDPEPPAAVQPPPAPVKRRGRPRKQSAGGAVAA